MHLLNTQDPVTTSWLLALAALFVVVVAIPLLRLLLSAALYALAGITGRHRLRVLAARAMPKLGHLLGSLIVGAASVAAPSIAAAEPQANAISVDRDGGHAPQQSPAPVPASEPTAAETHSTERSSTTGHRLYVVKTGDSLWDIAATQTPAASDAQITETWKAIWKANRKLVGAHPELIRPGMELVLDGTAE